MKNFLYLLILLAGVLHAEIREGESGIPAIDTLPVWEWDVETDRNHLPLALALSVFPGGMQYYFEHYTRGGFITAIELALLYEVFVNKEIQKNNRFAAAAQEQDSIAYYSAKLIESSRPDSFSVWSAARSRAYGRLRNINDNKMREEDLRRSETAWLIGMHLYSIMDGVGIWMHNQRRLTEKRSVGGAIWRAIALPGWGQFYNDEYGKAGLLYMSFIGSWVSYHSRQDMVEYFLERKHIAIREGAGSDEISLIQEDITFFRKKRNQYIWGPVLFWLYSIADAAVDASLSDFDSPLYFTWSPRGNPMVAFTLSF